MPLADDPSSVGPIAFAAEQEIDSQTDAWQKNQG